VIAVAEHLRGTIEGGFGRRLAAAAAARTAPGASGTRAGRGVFALLPAGFVAPPEAAPGHAATADSIETASIVLSAAAAPRARRRATRSATRRPAGARRPSAKGGRGRGRPGAPGASPVTGSHFIETSATGGATRLPGRRPALPRHHRGAPPHDHRTRITKD